MKRASLNALFLIFLLLLLAACGSNEIPNDFQQNDPSPYDLTKVTEGYGAVNDAWNSIDSKGVNIRLKDAIDATDDDFEVGSYTLANILASPNAPLAELLREDAAGVLSLAVDSSIRQQDGIGDGFSFYQKSPEVYNQGYYAFFDKLSAANVDVPDDYLSGMVNKLAQYAIDSIPLNEQNQPNLTWLNDQADELVDDLQDPDFHDNFIEVTKFLAKLMIQTDYPMYLNGSQSLLNRADVVPDEHTNLDLGNAVQGSHDLFLWLNKLVRNPDTRELLHAMIQNLADILDPDPQKKVAQRLKDYIRNVEAYFTTGGQAYGCDPAYIEDSPGAYSDAELNQTIREMLPMLQQLFLRSDRPNAMIVSQPGKPPVYPLDLLIDNLRNINFDPDKIDLEGSIDDLLRLDLWGRDRVTDPDAWPTSFLESLLFLTMATANHGWRDGGDTTEVSATTDSSNLHGHGAYAEELTLNDSLFSMHMLMVGGMGAYDVSLKDTDGNNVYRTRTPFTLSDVDQLYTGSVQGDDKDYRFFYNSNYGALQFLAGPGPGDLGAPDGGNPAGNSLGINQYVAYAPNGLHETQLAGWTMGWGVRVCFGGEGPYYYAAPNAQTVTVDGQPYHKYLRPNGKIYALVSLDGTRYLYPTDEGDTEDPETEVLSYNERRQRDNRYKSQWHSDYYMIHYNDPSKTPTAQFMTIDNSSGDAVAVAVDPANPDQPAGRLVYNETVAENDPKRACSSPEEAFFRNYQWAMTEKKMVLVLPMYFNFADFLEAGVFELMECNGWAGLADLRKFGANHEWAKKGGTGLSNVPGDYRMEFISMHTEMEGADDIMGAQAIYETNVDCGNATPSIVGHNLPALYRLGFPRSPDMDRGNGVTDKILGSQDFDVGDENWQKRNAFVPVLFSLLAGLREYSPAYDPQHRPGINAGMRTFLNQSSVIIKPLFYYYYDNGAIGTPNSWIPRVYGTQHYGNFLGKPFLQSSAEFYSGRPPAWFGSWDERRHYQPAVMKTQLNILIDSDLTDPQRRCDGILPLVTETKTLTNLFKLLLNPATETLPLEQIVSAMKFTKGRMTQINESPQSGKGLNYPDWMFAAGVAATRDIYGAYTEYEGVRQDDIILDDLLDMIIGRDSVDADHEGYGLAHYPDDKTTEEDWQDFYDTVDTLGDLLHEESPSTISPNLLALIDRLFAGEELYTSEEISGLLYNLGKLFGYYDPDLKRWIYQGEEGFSDIYNMLAVRVPALDNTVTQNEGPVLQNTQGPRQIYAYGQHYYGQLLFLANMAGSDGLLEFLFNTVTTPKDWGTVFKDINRFMAGKDIASPNSEFWPTLSQLLTDMGEAVGETHRSDAVDEIITDYGFQIN